MNSIVKRLNERRRLEESSREMERLADQFAECSKECYNAMTILLPIHDELRAEGYWGAKELRRVYDSLDKVYNIALEESGNLTSKYNV